MMTPTAQFAATSMADIYAAEVVAIQQRVAPTFLALREVADIIWSMNGTEFWVLLVHQRGWTAMRFEQWLVDSWTQLLLDDAHRGSRGSPPVYVV